MAVVVFSAYTIGTATAGYWAGRLVRRGEIVGVIAVVAPLSVVALSGLLYELGRDDNPYNEDWGGIALVIASGYTVGVFVIGLLSGWLRARLAARRKDRTSQGLDASARQ